jgi:hypothetical protein
MQAPPRTSRLAVGVPLVRRKPEVLRCLGEVLLARYPETEAAAVNVLRVAVVEVRGRLQLRTAESEAFLLASLVVAVHARQRFTVPTIKPLALKKPSETITSRAKIFASGGEAGDLAPNGVALFALALLGR